ncbi:hypothetical protein JCM10212_002133 [Sporobolomyces blumeae]
MLRPVVASIALAARAAHALSSHSPVDLEAYPAYAISLDQHHGVLNESLPALLHENLDAPPDSLAPKRHFLRTPSGQGFLCTVPSVSIASKQKAQAQADLDEQTRAVQRQRGLERGLALLEPMRAGCIYLKQNWFTYSFCYGSEIRQFHEVRVAGSPTPKEDPNSDAYVLGHAPEPTTYNTNPKYGSGSHEIAKKDATIPSRLGGGDGFALGDGGRYLSQMWEGGTICDKTGLPRTVEVQFHCNTQTIDRIALIRETSICRYVLLIHTPRLCAEPLFLEGADKSLEPPSTIECRPVVRELREPIPDRIDEGDGGRASQPLHDVVIEPPSTREVEGFSNLGLIAAPQRPQGRATQEPPSTGVGGRDPVTSDADYVDATVVLVYDPETGKVETRLETVEDQEGRVVFDQAGDKEVRRRIFGQGRGSFGGVDETDRGPGTRSRGDKKQVSYESLHDMVKMMTEALTDALDDSTHLDDGHEDSDGNDEAFDSTPDGSRLSDNDRRPRVTSREEILSLLSGFKAAGFDDETVEDLGEAIERDEEDMLRRVEEYVRSRRKGTTREGRDRLSGDERRNPNEEHEELRRGFARQYDRDDEDEGRVRDEL